MYTRTRIRELMAGSVKTMIRAYGLRVLLSGHPEVRRLKSLHISSFHGNKFWTSGWLLMEFFSRRGLPERTRVLDVGCGCRDIGDILYPPIPTLLPFSPALPGV